MYCPQLWNQALAGEPVLPALRDAGFGAGA